MPPVTRTLIIANVAVYLLESVAGTTLVEWFALWPPASGLSDAPGFFPWQLVTYGFLHGSLGHLFFNMLGLYMFGSDVERLFGSRFFTAYYLACVVTAAATHLVVNFWIGGPPAPTVGASGGVYGLLLAYGMYFPRRMVMLIIPPIPMRARTFVFVFGALELFLGVTGTAAGIAHFAHLGGMLGGWLMLRRRPR
ncbi:MAG: rhomboid family intramembrane serine protease [Betaproteobacteria bacterium]|nr:rhomboid family intramembrane serine protease [Betaproteobacteria bacterium]